jgi:aminoglycoside phosphotransferase (APT) family kinase protein
MTDDNRPLPAPFDRSAIDAALARRLVSAQFPQWADLPVRPVEVDGWDNRTFRLGDELSIRLPTGDWYARQVAKEHRWLPVLAPALPLPIPVPVAHGEPGAGYPFAWSVYRWLEGDLAAHAPIADPTRFAADLAAFLVALAAADASGGPEPGEHNFHRGGPLAHYEPEAVEAMDALGSEIPLGAVRRVWAAAMRTTWDGPPAWFHGDVAENNLLLRDGRLAAVLDFGSSGIGDPACDMVIAWTFLSGAARDRFRAARGVDAGTWSRGRGWALWKALITLVAALERGSPGTRPRRDIERVLADWADER